MSYQNNFKFYLSISLSLLITNVIYTSAKPHKLPTGEEWMKWNKCPTDSFVTGISLKLHVESDISTITGVRLYCTRKNVLSEGKNDFVDTIIQVDPIGQSSHWVKPVFCENGVASEFKVRHADFDGHRTVTNLRLICSDGEILKTHGHGTNNGVWTEGTKCSPRHAICGLETQVFPTNGNNVFTEARVHCCDVMNPAITCTPSERWQLVTECENSEALVPETCGFEKKVGTSYAGKERETRIYENIGFTLNGVSTDLSGKPQFQEGVVNDATQYKWSTAGHETWMPETKTNETIEAVSGHKSTVYQVVGHCGFYRIRTSQFKVESSPVTKSGTNNLEHSKDEHENKHAHVGKHNDHHKPSDDDHDPNIQADFGGEDSWESDDWDDEEQVDETGKLEQEPVKVESKTDEKQVEKKTSDDSFEDNWDTSSEEKTPVHFNIPVVEEKAKSQVEEKKDSNESIDEWVSSEETKSEVEIPAPVVPKADSTEKKEESNDSFKDLDNSDEENKPEAKVDDPPPVAPTLLSESDDTNQAAEKIESNKDGHDDWDNSSEEKKPEAKVDDAAHAPEAPALAPRTEDAHKSAEKKDSNESFGHDDWNHSEEKKPEEKANDAAPIFPTLVSKVEVKEASAEKKESEEDFSDDTWDHSAEKDPEVIEAKEEVSEIKVNNQPLHEPTSVDSKKEERQGADDSFSNDWEDSEEKTHEAKVMHAHEDHSQPEKDVKEESNKAVEDNSEEKESEDSKKPEVVKTDDHVVISGKTVEELEKSKPESKVDLDMELMAKDTPSDEWVSSEESEEIKPQEKTPNNPVPPQHVHGHHGDAEVHHSHLPAHQNENMNMPETAAQVADSDDYWDDDDFVVEIPETKFEKMERQDEHQEPVDNSDTESLKFPDFKGTFDTAGEAVKDTVVPLTDQIGPAIDDIGKAVEDAKDSPLLKDIKKTLSEVLDAAGHPAHDDQQAHQDDEVIPKVVEEATQGLFSNETSQGEPQKAQSAILGYIVGGMVAGVVIIVIVIFVLERRQPKKRPDEADNEGGGVRDQPLLGGYKKDVALAVGSDKDAF